MLLRPTVTPDVLYPFVSIIVICYASPPPLREGGKSKLKDRGGGEGSHVTVDR
jgi:hypothetical protein